ncbi:MAG: RusA family crossover junction endodeoxyribonuclease [Pseudomonadota bacterium]
MILSITIPGIPVAKGRARLSTRGGFARAYTPAKTRHYEDQIRCEAAGAMGDRPPLDEAVSIVITAYVAPPKSLSKKRRADALDGTAKPLTRPDLDNYAKAALDGCNAIIFRDDSLVTDLIVRKRYSERPRLTITVESGEDFA